MKSHSKKVKIQPFLEKSENISLLEKEWQISFFLNEISLKNNMESIQIKYILH